MMGRVTGGRRHRESGAVEADAEETFEYHDEGEATTSLAGFFKDIKL